MLPTIGIDTVSEFTRGSAIQATVSEGLAQDPYVATRAGFEPTTLRSKRIDSTNAPQRPTFTPTVLLGSFRFLFLIICKPQHNTMYHVPSHMHTILHTNHIRPIHTVRHAYQTVVHAISYDFPYHYHTVSYCILYYALMLPFFFCRHRTPVLLGSNILMVPHYVIILLHEIISNQMKNSPVKLLS